VGRNSALYAGVPAYPTTGETMGVGEDQRAGVSKEGPIRNDARFERSYDSEGGGGSIGKASGLLKVYAAKCFGTRLIV